MKKKKKRKQKEQEKNEKKKKKPRKKTQPETIFLHDVFFYQYMKIRNQAGVCLLQK